MWLLDLAVVLAVFVYNVPILPMYGATGPRLIALATVSVGLCAPYLFRRRYPLAVFAVIWAAAWVHLALGAPLIPADVMLLLAVYNVATRYRWSVSLPAGLAVVAWLLVAVVPRIDADFVDIGELALLIALIALVWMWGMLVRVRRHYVASLQERARQLEREREAQAQIAVAEERSRIAREIHDIVSHSLSVVVVMSEGAASTVDLDPERARSAMLGVRDTGRNALAEMRRMLGVLRDDEPGSHAPQPGIAHLDQLIQESTKVGLPVTLAVEGEPVPVLAGVDVAVYRIVQEALTNVRKHGGASVHNVEVQLDYGCRELAVRVTDDGRGFDDEADSHAVGHGLVGMRERVAAHGGTLRTGMRPSGGFEVSAVLPIGDER